MIDPVAKLRCELDNRIAEGTRTMCSNQRNSDYDAKKPPDRTTQSTELAIGWFDWVVASTSARVQQNMAIGEGSGRRLLER